MRHRLFTLLSAVSLLLCVATVGLWVRSYFREDRILRNDPGEDSSRNHRSLLLYSVRGCLVYSIILKSMI